MAALDTKYKFKDMVLTDDDPYIQNGSDNTTRYVAVEPFRQRFGYRLTFKKQSERLNAELYSFLCHNKRGFDLPNPRRQLGNGLPLGSFLTRAVTPVLSTTIPVTAPAALLQNILLPGAMLTSSSHKKSYMVRNVVNTDASGRADIEIYPPLFEQLNLNTPLNIERDAFMQVKLQSDTTDLGIAFHDMHTPEVSIDVKEIL